ncbi:hypothetical protein ABG840_10800, partial [Phocaeicola vulgatus]
IRMSLAKEKDLFKKRTYLFYLPARPALPHLPSNVPGERPGIFSKLLLLFVPGKLSFFVSDLG